jgi:hypothetical protein
MQRERSPDGWIHGPLARRAGYGFCKRRSPRAMEKALRRASAFSWAYFFGGGGGLGALLVGQDGLPQSDTLRGGSKSNVHIMSPF